jgi:ATP-dependent helicase/nuclease subunit A
MSAGELPPLATDPAVSAWVSANAGAGKTHVLTDRVTRLLLDGADPARILCLTYTKAAAAEMASRLFARLGEWALLPDATLSEKLMAIGAGTPDADALRLARRLFAQALETPGGLKIQTIHSFCQMVLSRFPVEAGVPPRFAVLDERSAAELMRAARHAVLERAGAGEAPLKDAVAVLAARAHDGRFGEILDLAIGQADRLRRLTGKDARRFFARVRRQLDIGEGEDESSVLTQFCAELGGERGDCERIARWLSDGGTNDRNAGAWMTEFLQSGMAPEAFSQLRLIFFTKGNELRQSFVSRPTANKDPALAARLQTLCERVERVEQRRRAAITASLTEAVVTVALAVLGEYRRMKRERAVLDYDDLILSTMALLEKSDAALWVLHKLDGGLDHILVDEAQDTSPQQWSIVVKLAEEFFSGKGARERARPRTLFAVGDEKQSIFSFQGADPEAFGRHLHLFKARVEAAGLAFADLRPTVSRRSTKSVLDFVDAVFARDEARDGLTSSGDPIRHDPHRKELGRVEVWPAVKADKVPERDLWRPVDETLAQSAPMILAAKIAKRIRGWLDSGTTLPESGKPIGPGDIMILVRRRNEFAREMIRKLMEHGVPVAGADRMVLMDQIAIADLVALGRFALLPEDDLTLAALLTSPLVALSENELLELAAQREGRLWTALRTRKDERPEFARAHAFLADIRAQADFVAPFEFYARALAKGLRRQLVARLGAEAADAIDEFLALALAYESAHPPSLEGFLDWFEKGASEVKRDMEQGAGAVRVMTVHGAKGLEANIVILPDTAQIAEQERRAGLLYTEDCVFFGVNKALNTPAIEKAKDEAARREMREYRRLLYVATTRAREWLILTGYETRNGRRPESWYELVRGARAPSWREEQIDDETVLALGAALPGAGARSTEAESGATAVPAFLTRAAPVEPEARIVRPSDAADAHQPAPVSPIEDDGARFRRGLMIHALLAHLPEVPEIEREKRALAYLKREGIEHGDAKEIVAECFAVLRHPEFAPLFTPKSRAEVGVTALLPEFGNLRVSGQIDRLAVTDDAVLIADFKTNRPPPKTPDGTPAIYLAQMALYRAALARIYPGRRVECALIWTVGPQLMKLPSELSTRDDQNRCAETGRHRKGCKFPKPRLDRKEWRS